jgi:magnesium transporter
MAKTIQDIDLNEILDTLRELIKTEQVNFALPIIADLHPADIAEIMAHLDDDERKSLFNIMPPDKASEVLVELEENVKEDVLEELDSAQIAEMVNEMDSDDATDILSDMSEEQVNNVLKHVEEENSEEIQELLSYREDTAGGIMAKEFVSVHASSTVQIAIEEIRKKLQDVEDIYYCFVTDDFGTLVGSVPLRNLILSEPTAKIKDIMDPDIVSINSNMDQEEVAYLFKKYNFVVAPVVNDRNKLIGRITVDDVVDVIGEEIEEDLGRIAGTGEEEVLEDSVMQISRARLPWLALSFVGQIIAAIIMKYFQGTIQQIIASTFFIPMVMAMGGSVGQQSSIIVVRGLVTGEITLVDTARRLKRELFVALFNGFILALLIFAIIVAWNKDYVFGTLLAVSLIVIIINASIFGAVIPLLFKKINVDPALATGPFVATFNDVVGLSIYFALLTFGFSYVL